MATKKTNTKTAKRRTTTKALPKGKKDVKAGALKQVKGGLLSTYDLKAAKK